MDVERRGERDTMLVAADDDRWAWRARVKRNPATRRLYRGLVFVVGVALLLVGLAAIPLPGPGWAMVFLALAVLASEFEPAARLLDFARRHVKRWTAWIGEQALYIRALVALGTVALVLAIFWVYFSVSGVPGWIPEAGRNLLLQVPGL